MKKQKGITLVSLVVTIIVLILLAGISINLLLGENGIITKAKEAKKMQEIAEIKENLSLEISAAETDAILRNENLEKAQLEDIINKYGILQEDGDTIITKEKQYEISLKEIWYGVLSESGSYSAKVEQIEILEKELAELQEKYNELEEINSGNSEILEELRTQITELENEKSALEESLNNAQEKIAELENIKQLLGQTTVTEDKILKDYKAYSNGQLLTGTMANNGTLSASLKAGQSYQIPKGYTEGGTIQAVDLATQTQATATAGDILSGKTAWANGTKITGTMVNRGTLNWSPTTSTTYTVPAGYYSGGTLNSSGAYNAGYNEGYNEGYNIGKSSISNSYHFSYALNDYNMKNWVTMETIKYDGICLITIGFISKNSTNNICDYVNCRLVDSSRKSSNHFIF